MDQVEERMVGGRTAVWRRGDVVLRAAGPWSPSVRALLRHLEQVGFAGAPRVVGSGVDEQGRETLSFVEGEFVHPKPWREEGLVALGALLRRLHDATASFVPPADARWHPWFGRGLGEGERVIGHGDTGPWNVVADADGLPIALIDWDTAGPVDPLIELGQACWLNAQLHDDDVAERVGLADAPTRARHAALIAEGYGLARGRAARLVTAMIDVAVADAADQAITARVTPDTTDATALWGLAWRARAAAWMVRHRALLTRALG